MKFRNLCLLLFFCCYSVYLFPQYSYGVTGLLHSPSAEKMCIRDSPGIEDIDAHFYYLLDAFRDKRYYKIDGRLLFVIYAPLKLSLIHI